MHVGFIIYGDINTLTGGYLYDRILVENLRQQGHTVTLLSLPHRSYLWRIFDNFRKSTWSIIGHNTYDILLQDELCHPSLLSFNRRFHTQTHTPIVTIVHQVFCDEPRNRILNLLYRQLEKRYLTSVDGSIFNSKTTLTTVSNLNIPQKPYVIAPPGGDRFATTTTEAHITKRTKQVDPLRLLFLGNVISRKGLIPLIRALATSKDINWLLDIAGNTEMDRGYMHRVKMQINSAGLSERIKFRGTLTGSTLHKTISASHLLCMPFSYEGFGISTLEALSQGVPVIGSTTGATPELIQDGVNGFLLQPADISGLRLLLARYCAEPQLRLQMSLNAQKSFTLQPTWRETMRSVESFLAKMAENVANRTHSK